MCSSSIKDNSPPSSPFLPARGLARLSARPPTCFIECRRQEPPLPEMPFPTPPMVDSLGIAAMKRFPYPLQALFGLGHRDQGNMIGHEAIGQNIDFVFLAVFPLGQTGADGSSQSGQRRKLATVQQRERQNS